MSEVKFEVFYLFELFMGKYFVVESEIVVNIMFVYCFFKFKKVFFGLWCFKVCNFEFFV